MERPWPSFDFAVDISAWHERKRAAIAAYESIFRGNQLQLVERYAAQDQYWGSLLGVRHAEPVSRRVYGELMHEKDKVIRGGYTAIADPVFIKPDERGAVRHVAKEAGVPFAGLWIWSAGTTWMRRARANKFVKPRALSSAPGIIHRKSRSADPESDEASRGDG